MLLLIIICTEEYGEHQDRIRQLEEEKAQIITEKEEINAALKKAAKKHVKLKEIADKNFQNAKTYLERALPLLSADKPREKSMIDNIKKLLPQIEAQLK